MENRKHHPMSPSMYPALSECTCYKRSEADSAESSAGSAAHDETVKFIENGIEPDSKTARWFGETALSLAGGNPIQCEHMFLGCNGKLSGVYGYVDAYFERDGVFHIVDFKTFSDGSKDYRPQLEGYASLMLTPNGDNADSKVVFHILHGGSRMDESWESTVGECHKRTTELIERVQESHKPRLCGWCQYCASCKECPSVSSAVQVVSDNGVAFNKLSICQKLVVLDAVDKLSKSIREEAKQLANENNGAIETDGIRYEMKPWAGASYCNDICLLASDMKEPSILVADKKTGGKKIVRIVGITNDELLKMCNIPKSKVIECLKAKNSGNAEVRKSDIERLVGMYYANSAGTPHFVRTK